MPVYAEEIVRRILFLTALVAAISLACGGGGSSEAQTKATPAKAKAASTTISAPQKAFGSKSAPITMEVFSDFQCPSCRMFYHESIKPLMNDYVHPGKVYFIHRDFPLQIHPYARDAARYANAAGTFGKFEKVAEAIYGTQEAWAANRSRLEAAVASALTPDEMNRVRQLMNNPVVEQAIDKDMQLGAFNRVGSTPTVILTHNGRVMPLPGTMNYPLLKRVLDQLLAGR